jgi:hypothetical protein
MLVGVWLRPDVFALALGVCNEGEAKVVERAVI